jgi:hypothetical protein
MANRKKIDKAAGKKLGIDTRAMPRNEVKKLVEKYSKYTSPKAKKAVAKKTVGRAVGNLLPGVGAAILARDVIKGVSKATCGKRGGKWVSGKCVGTKKTKFKPGAKVRDPISKR